jgi:lipid II:glycine glycyltransferase (peptidoglycan interpeptide bridge formation enzyme)
MRSGRYADSADWCADRQLEHYRTVADPDTWNKALLQLPVYHVLQCWDWGAVKTRHGWVADRLLWERDDRPVAAAQVLWRPLPHTPWGVLYVPKGPALDYGDSELVRRTLGGLEAYGRQQQAIFVKIDPDINSDEVVERLVGRGWRYSDEQIQFRNTALLDLRPSEADLLAGMKSKTRYNTRLAGRRGVTVREGTIDDIPNFYRMYAETGKRDEFTIREFEYYEDAWRTFLEGGLAHMLLAEVNEKVIAGLILFRFGDKAWYMYGASTARHRNKMPNYALQWEAIRWARSVGCTMYDLWGAPDTLDDEDQLWGVWRFKEGLGAQFVPHIGAYDYPVSRPLYWAYTVLMPAYHRWLGRRK